MRRAHTGHMPELPEVSALVDFLTPRLVGEFIAQVDIAELSLLHTADPPLDAVIGLEITGVRRVGKALVIDFDGLSLVCRFARAGWLVWHDAAPSTPVRMGKGPLGMRVTFASGSGFDLTEAGTKKNASVSLVRDLGDVAALADAGPDALEITAEQFTAALAGKWPEVDQPIVDQDPGLVDVKTHPLLVGAFSPLDEVLVSQVRSIRLIVGFLDRRLDDRHPSLGHHGMSPVHRGHVDHRHPGTTVGQFQGSREP